MDTVIIKLLLKLDAHSSASLLKFMPSVVNHPSEIMESNF